MQNLKVTLVQADQIWEDKSANCNNYLALLKDIDTDLIVLPEMFNTGFSMNVKELAEDWQNSKSVNWLQKLSKDKDAAIYTSLIIRDDKSVFNRGVFIFPTGEIEYYDKRKSFALAGEDKYFKSGEKEVIVTYKNWKIQLQICFDLRFPEMVRNRMTAEQQPAYDLILYVANWPEKRIDHWDSLLSARAIENQCYTIGVNRVGVDKNQLNYCGNSTIVHPSGLKNTLAKHIEQVITIELNHNALRELQAKLPFLPSN